MSRPYVMYEQFIVYMDHVALHRLLTVDDPRRRLFRWRLRLAEVYLGVKYKKREIKAQADVLF